MQTKILFLHRLLTTVLIFVFLIGGCSLPTGLENVSGVEGRVVVSPALFADGKVTAITLVVLDQLDLENLGEHFITYSDPILPCNTACDSVYSYFIQLKRGSYAIVPIGLMVPVATVATSLDSLLALPELPIRLPTSDSGAIIQYIKSVVVREGEISEIDGNWQIVLEVAP